jgi:hypothetical protein
MVATALAAPAATVRSSLTVTLAAEVVTAGAPTMGLAGEPRAEATADEKQDPVQWLRCYALSIENAGGNNDTKCLYFPFCLDQAPLTWLKSLEKYSVDKWDQLKEQFNSNFVGAMGRSGTRIDLAMVKQEQGETLRKYM